VGALSRVLISTTIGMKPKTTRCWDGAMAVMNWTDFWPALEVEAEVAASLVANET
jgi:hypothetical protein